VFTYDAEGDRTGVSASNGSSATLSYNQALELTDIGGAGSYAYNGDGLRMSKTVGATKAPFTWDVAGGLPLLLEDVTNAYIYGPGGLPLEQVNGNTALWLHHDQLGSTRLLTSATGASMATYAYTTYGSLSSSSGTASTPLLFAGQYRDGESALYYMRARYYDPSTAQFLTRDPAVVVTQSPYAYVAGNPVNRTDPSGLVQCANDPSKDCGPVDTGPSQPANPCDDPVYLSQHVGQCEVIAPGTQAITNLQDAWDACNKYGKLDACARAAELLVGKGINKLSDVGGALYTWGGRIYSFATRYGGDIVGACGNAAGWLGGAASGVWEWVTGTAPNSYSQLPNVA
jgi:RHS repeat-associated protein